MEHLLTVAQLGQMRFAARFRLSMERAKYRTAIRQDRPATATIIRGNVTALEAAIDVLDDLLDGSGASAKISLVEREPGPMLSDRGPPPGVPHNHPPTPFRLSGHIDTSKPVGSAFRRDPNPE